MKKVLLFLITITLFCTCANKPEGHKIVLCIPVYGQSLALGEEAERITDFDSLAAYADGRIVTENLDHEYGYFDNNSYKQWVKEFIGYQKRAYELSVYNMAKILTDKTGTDTLICIFPGGQGGTALKDLCKGSIPYQQFIKKIEKAYNSAHDNGWDFLLPAICWMQGESDIADYPEGNYRQLLTQIRKDMDDDIRRITHQKDSIRFVCYQPNSLTRAPQFQANSYSCHETSIPQTFVDLLQEDDLFWASGPTYPYSCVGEVIHIDAIGQQNIGKLAARSVLGLLRGANRYRGLIPTGLGVNGDTITIKYNTSSILTLDTIQVRKADHYGFIVINKEDRNIANDIVVNDNTVKIICSESPLECKVRYAVNGEYMKSGNQSGPRGNLRDTSGNWCYQFDMPLGN